MKHWKVWVDTGGTFTDCIAVAPDGSWLRQKVMSSSRLRAEILNRVNETTYSIREKWEVSEDIFQGYVFQLEGDPNTRANILSCDLARGHIKLDRPLALEPGTFEILSPEEAPILAARMITQTPLQEELPPMEMRLGTTKGTNALLEHKGARVTLLITRGFEDLLYIGKQQRPNLFGLAIPEPECWYDSVFEIPLRMDRLGNVMVEPDPECWEKLIKRLRKAGSDAVAIALLHSYRNPGTEDRISEILRQAGFDFVSASSSVASNLGFEARTRTCVIDAYLSPIMRSYLDAIQKKIGPGSRLLVMSSDGSLKPAHAYQAKDSLLSGPAGGVVGAGQVGQDQGLDHLIAFDMGGTSTDVSLWKEKPRFRSQTVIARQEMAIPSIELETVAAGGGSICAFDGHQLSVGPESAGSFPGPACYGAGGPLTITDVNLLLGKMDPESLSIPIQLEKAVKALLQLKKKLDKALQKDHDPESLLRGLEQIANEKMAGAIRTISVSQGEDPRPFSLVAFGGAGGMHACRLAELMQMETVIFPADAGLLSARGMGHAQISRTAVKELRVPLGAFSDIADQVAKELEKEVFNQLEQDGYPRSLSQITERNVFLKLKGQSFSLPVIIGETSVMEKAFAAGYEKVFGYLPKGILEAERMEVRATTHSEEKQPVIKQATPHSPHASKTVRNYFSEKKIPVFAIQGLNPGAICRGPAILAHPYFSSFLESGWEAQLGSHGHWIGKKTASTQVVDPASEAVARELFTNRFTQIAREMGAQLQRTSMSVNIRDRLDFSCALLDPDGYLLVNAPHIPVHLGSLGICARLILKEFTLDPGDVILTNHPKYGGSHLPDMTLMQGIFSKEGTLLGYAINRAHHAEVGGKRPGSMPPDARSLAEEGVVIPPFYLLRKGDGRWEELKDLLSSSPWPSRAAEENLADLNAALASLQSGRLALIQLVEEHGWDQVHYYMNALQDVAQASLWSHLPSLDGKILEATEFLDDGHRIQVQIYQEAQELVIDFEGTSPVHPGNLNANAAIVHSAVMYVLRLICGEDIPLNEGLMASVRICFPENCFLSPHFPEDPEQCPAVVGGNTETSQRLVDTLLKAFGIVACGQGTMNNLVFGNESFGYYETIGGGAGAGPGFHGRSGVHQHMTNTRITDPEELEWRYPVRLHHFGLRKGSGGKGKWKGGDGLIREMEFLEPVQLTLLTQHRLQEPFGREGGENGAVGRQWVIRKNGEKEELKGMDQVELEAGDRIHVETPGGGGWGGADCR